MLYRSFLAAAAIVLGSAQADAAALTDRGELTHYPVPIPVSGLGAGETLLAIDTSRVISGLYGITATGLYSINGSGAATPIGSAGAFNLTGTAFDMDIQDFEVRIISNSGQNFRVDVRTGAFLGSDASFTYRADDLNAGHQANIVAIAYHTYYGGLYGVDADLDTWVLVDERTGLLTTMGSWGVDVSEDAGFDFDGPTGRATLVTTPNGSNQSRFYDLDPGTHWIGDRGPSVGGYRIVDLALSTVPEPAAWAMMVLGFGFAGAAARRKPAPEPLALV